MLAELPVAFLEAADDLAFDVFTDACLVKAGVGRPREAKKASSLTMVSRARSRSVP